jgi:hypothetical protein
MQAVRDAITRSKNGDLQRLLAQVIGDAASRGADRGGSTRGTGSGSQETEPYVFPAGGVLHQGAIGFVEGIDYTVVGDRIGLSITLHGYERQPFVCEFGRTMTDHIPGVEEIKQLLSHIVGTTTRDSLTPSSQKLIDEINRFATSIGVTGDRLRDLRLSIIACLKPQADESRTITAKHLIEQGSRPVVFTGDLRAFYSCAKKNITAIFVSSTSPNCLYYKRKEGGGGIIEQARNIARNVFMARAARSFLGLFRRGDEISQESKKKKSQVANLLREIRRANGIVYKNKRKIEELKKELDTSEAPREVIEKNIADAEKLIEDTVADIEEKKAQIFSLTGQNPMGGGGGDKGEEEVSVQRHIQIVRVMTAYLLNNLTKLLSENIHETMPDVLIYIVPLFTIVPDGQTITDYVNPTILDRSGNYINNLEVRMPILALFDELIDPCTEGGDINECVDTFMEYAGYFLDEPVVGVLKRVMQGEVVSDGEIDNPAFNGIDVISRHKTLFTFMRPPVAGKKRGRPDDFVPSTPLPAPGYRHPLASMLTPDISEEERPPAPPTPSTIERPRYQRGITAGGAVFSITRRRKRQQEQKLRTRKQQKASRLGGLQATFEIVPHQP